MDIWKSHSEKLKGELSSSQKHPVRFTQSSLSYIARNSAALQEGALRNGAEQPMLIVRMKTKECKITVFPGDEIFAGDYVDCFGERWLVIESYTDEHGIQFSKAWLCNHLFKFQNRSGKVIERRGVIDDGSYSASSDKRLPLEEGFFRAYLPLDEDTEKIFIDQRFAIGTAYNAKQELILSTVKVGWIDKQSGNSGAGSHLLRLRLETDIYNAQADNFEKMICNYVPEKEPDAENEATESEDNTAPALCRIDIDGRDSLRLGTSRTYVARVLDGDGETVEMSCTFVWGHSTGLNGVVFNIDEDKCTISVPLTAALIGTEIELTVADSGGLYKPFAKKIEVIA